VKANMVLGGKSRAFPKKAMANNDRACHSTTPIRIEIGEQLGVCTE
jgi:hypothetical protein